MSQSEAERIEAILAEHMHEGYFETKDGHRECFCGHVMAEGERYREHLAAALVAAETGGLAELCAEAITQVASSPHGHWREGGIGGTCRTCEAASERAADLSKRLTALLAQPAPSDAMDQAIAESPTLKESP